MPDDAGKAPRSIGFDASALKRWDTKLLACVTRLLRRCESLNVDVDLAGLPEGARRLLALATATPPRPPAPPSHQASLLARIGSRALKNADAAHALVTFLGEAILSLLRLVSGKARMRRGDFFVIVQDCGAKALGIVTLISFLVGLILAFIGAIQLQRFGAEIYVADLVGIGMTREMGAMMAAIIMAGRTGAAFAAQLGTMMVNEEIDALKTMGISPMDFLVLPRMLALALMMPLLCVYADVIGIAGGAIVGIGMLGLTPTQYWIETQGAVDLTDIGVGLSKSVAFGVLVALAGCLRGMQSGRSAAAVGEAATSAVVTAIVWIIVTDAVFAVLTNVLGI